MRYINGTRLDDRIVRTDWDAGFVEGRQYGRGKTGGQVSLCHCFKFLLWFVWLCYLVICISLGLLYIFCGVSSDFDFVLIQKLAGKSISKMSYFC